MLFFYLKVAICQGYFFIGIKVTSIKLLKFTRAVVKVLEGDAHIATITFYSRIFNYEGIVGVC